MYKNKVKNDRKIFEIPALLSCEWGTPEWESSKYYIYNFEFSRSRLPHSQDKRAGISIFFLSFFTLFFYIP